MGKQKPDVLYTLFEQHLSNLSFVDESADEFISVVLTDYWEHLQASGHVIPNLHAEEIKEDIEFEIREMLIKKTYGHFDLAEYRKAQKQGSRPH